MIYVITAIRPDESRPMGYIEHEATALDLVRRNHKDLNEAGYYPHVVVEAIEQGIHPIPERRWFFEWTVDGYNLMETEPEWAKDIFAYGLG